MHEDEKNLPLSVRRDNQRRADALPTNEELRMPTFGLNNHKQAAGNARIRAHEVQKLTEFHRRRFGNDPSPEWLSQQLDEQPNDAA